MAPATGHSEINLNDLLTQKIYKDMNKDYTDLSKYSAHCERAKWNKNEDQVKEICKKYLRYLEKSTYWNFINPEFDVCRLLNYWIYDTLTSIFGDKDTSEHIEFAFSKLQYIWGYTVNAPHITTYYKKCNPDFNIFKHPDWKKRKELYEYYVDYTTIKGLSDIDMSECKSYYEYIKKKEELYEHFDKECKSSEYICPEFYGRSKNYIPKEVLPKLQCHGQISADRAAADKASTKESSSHHPSSAEGSIPGPAVNHQLGGPAASYYAEQSPETSGIGTKVANSVLGAAPVLLTATALYRYTPIGPWIRRFAGGRSNGVGAIDVVPNYMQETGDIFSNNDANYISYQPM